LSPAPGTCAGLQLPAAFQSDVPPSHTMSALRAPPQVSRIVPRTKEIRDRRVFIFSVKLKAWNHRKRCVLRESCRMSRKTRPRRPRLLRISWRRFLIFCGRFFCTARARLSRVKLPHKMLGLPRLQYRGGCQDGCQLPFGKRAQIMTLKSLQTTFCSSGLGNLIPGEFRNNLYWRNQSNPINS
jgi:hypothetical protein